MFIRVEELINASLKDVIVKTKRKKIKKAINPWTAIVSPEIQAFQQEL